MTWNASKRAKEHPKSQRAEKIKEKREDKLMMLRQELLRAMGRRRNDQGRRKTND